MYTKRDDDTIIIYIPFSTVMWGSLRLAPIIDAELTEGGYSKSYCSAAAETLTTICTCTVL